MLPPLRSRRCGRPPGSETLAWVIGATFLHFTSLYYLFATLPLYVLDVGGSIFQAGLIIGVFSLASLAVRPLFGFWMDLAGRKRFLIVGALIYVVASLGYLAIETVPGLLVWRVFHAMGLATFSTAAASLAGDLAPHQRRGSTMGLFGLAQAGALSLAPGMGQILQHALGYRGLFLAAAGTAFLSLLCALAIPKKVALMGDVPAQRANPKDRLPPFLPRVAGAAAMQFAASIAYGTIVSLIAVVARQRGLDVAGAYFALLALSSLGIRLLAGRFYDIQGQRAVLMPAFLALTVGMSLLAATVHARTFLATAVLAGAGIGATHTALLARVVERCPVGARGRAVATFTSCWELGVGGGTIIMGRLAEIAGFSSMFLLVAAIPAGGLLGLFLVRGGHTEAC